MAPKSFAPHSSPAPSPSATSRAPHCAECALRRSGHFTPVSSKELAFIQDFRQSDRRVAPGTVLIREGGAQGKLYTLYSGWAFRFKTLSDGRRQILNFLLPGDFIGMQQYFADSASYGVEALTPLSLCVFPQAKLMGLFKELPGLGFDLTWLAASQKAVIDDNLLTTGRRNATERVAMLLVQLYERAERVGLVDGGGMAFPLNQQHVADALGLSLVHTNKTMRRLRLQGLYRIDNGRLTLPDLAALRRVADADATPLRALPLI